MEGELYRFKPGIENNFISRWVQISNRAFRYFRNHIHAMGSNKPIVAVPKLSIEDVFPIDIDSEAFLKRKHIKE